MCVLSHSVCQGERIKWGGVCVKNHHSVNQTADNGPTYSAHSDLGPLLVHFSPLEKVQPLKEQQLKKKWQRDWVSYLSRRIQRFVLAPQFDFDDADIGMRRVAMQGRV